MDRDDADHEGITLPPADHMAFIARQEADRAIMRHLRLCPFSNLQIEYRLRAIENRLSLLIGLMLGSGLIGGATATVIGKLVGP
jgi:hypothetical protein